jgi:hypothetical protein
MILTFILAALVGVMFAVCVAQLALVVYLLRCRKRAVRTIETLSSNVYALAIERASREQKPNLLWYDKRDKTLH